MSFNSDNSMTDQTILKDAFQKTKKILPILPIKYEQRIGIVLPVENIPNSSIVTKLTGDKEYIFKRSLNIYTTGDTGETLNIKGFFLIDQREGNINQIENNKKLIWITTASLFYDYLHNTWGVPEAE